MTKVRVDISMSLDGFITGPNAAVGNPLGDDDGRLHDWMFDAKTDDDDEVRAEVYASTGAIIMGKGMFEVGVEPWGDPPPFGMPVFVLTHEPREPMPMKGGTTYSFVTDGLESALEQAKEAAAGKDVGIWGGGGVVSQYLRAGFVDEMQVHLVPVLLGEGVPLFEQLGRERIELQRTRAITTRSATHLRFALSSEEGPTSSRPQGERG